MLLDDAGAISLFLWLIIQARRKPQKRVKVIAPAVEEAKGQRPASPASEFEGKVLSVLSILGLLVLVLGVFLAASVSLRERGLWQPGVWVKGDPP